ncbi:MAG: hypothetical protein EOP86_22770 [Verrucomicrobiaceae bacterium]|nr:MAG: hypothetical protein EOP86_22770 [Verrucomicrobiaceae bacterium]
MRLTASASLPAGASASEIRLAALQDRLAAIHDTDPSPALRVDGPPATAEEMEAWRERIISLTVPLEEEMRPLSQPLVDRATQQLLEHVHEQLR